MAILLSTYNGERFLPAQLDSLLAQTHAACDIWLRDDGSTDATLAIVHRYAEQHPRIRVKRGANLGFVGSFHDLLHTAGDGYDFYCYCDQDDVWQADKVACAVAALAGRDGVAMYCSRTEYVDEQLAPLGFSPAYALKKVGWGNALVQNIATGCTVALNADARRLLLAALPRQCLAHDWWAYLVVAAFGQVVFDPQSHILYRQHGRNTIGMVQSGWSGQWARGRRLLRRLRQRGPDWPDQLREFERCHGARLAPWQREQLQVLVRSRSGRLAAIRAAGQAFYWRMSPVDTLILRCLLALRLY